MPDDLARCDQEIAEILARPQDYPHPAYLSVMGLIDWQMERAWILREVEASGRNLRQLARIGHTSAILPG